MLANTGQLGTMLLEAACQAHPMGSKQLSSNCLVIPELCNFQPTSQCVTMLYKAFWMG